MMTAVFGYSTPVFVVGYILAYIFALRLDWLPVQGFTSISQGLFPFLRNLILPAVALGLVFMALLARITRATMLDVLAQDYVRTAKAKGLPRFRIVALHALRNALIPVVTVIGLQVGVLFTGAILTETIFSWPGIGKWMIDAIFRRDYPVLQGGALLLGIVVMAVNLLVDVAYGLINPRIRHHR